MNIKNQESDQASRLAMEPLLTTKDIGRILSVQRKTVQGMIRRGDIPRPIKLGGNRWRRQDIEDLIERVSQAVRQSDRKNN